MQPKGEGENTQFQARREPLHEESHGAAHGGTEMGWLVSYADMMTLLFGLFVILFSLTTDPAKSDNVDDIMKEVSKKYFSDQAGNQPTPSAQNPDSSTPPPPNVETVMEQMAEMQALYESEKQQFVAKIDELKAEVAQLEQEKTEEQNKTKATQRKVSSIQDPTTDLKKEIQSLQDKMQEKKKDFEKLHEELEKKKAENEFLHKELNKQPSQNYMMVLLTWETEKHDLDLQVTTPKKANFNFKKRKWDGQAGAFELDSRFGPGIEMWKAENFEPGEYKVKSLLYNKNGNEASAKAQVTVVTNLRTYKSELFEMASRNSEFDLSFVIDAQGAVRFGK
ncbi:flagellar motor protein MotB [Bdellovibrio sp.]|uniref:flagellar motor protein MotB n=1 Tax=Bdellovibrio sp. TaxID=28201 RepID=UPI0039E2208C